MIRIYPSRLPGQPLEVHEHRATTVDGWLRANVPGYPGEGPQPIEVDVEGRPVPVDAWATTEIAADSDVRIYPVPRDPVILSIISVAVSIAFAVYAYLALRQDTNTPGTGSAISLNTAKANTAKLGDPIREILGRYRVYPDYLVQPVSRFVNRANYQTSLFVCVGRGHYTLPVGAMRIGTTPLSSFGGDVSMTVYPPGADVSGDARSENWFNSTEVGGTTSGTAGLDLSVTTDTHSSTNADSVTVQGTSLTLNNATVTHDNGNVAPATAVPTGWAVGAVLTLKVSANYTASNSGLYSVIEGAPVDELAPFVGMPVLLTYNDADYSLFIASYSPRSEAAEPQITLAYNSATGTAFSGLPAGAVTLAIGRALSEYVVTAVDGLTIQVARLTEAGVQDSRWPGWIGRTTIDYDASGLQEGDQWLGPFLTCPDGERSDAFEVDFNAPGGFCRYNGKGKRVAITITLRVAYRVYGSGNAWTVRSYSYTENSEDGIGFTERITLPSASQVEVRVRRITAMWGGNSREDLYWQGLRSRLSARPARYEGITTIGLTVTTGSKLGAQSDRRFNVLATREYAQGQARTISGAIYHVLDSLNTGELVPDTDTIGHLERTYWTPRGEFFDYSADADDSSVLDVLKMIAQAGMGYFLLSEGMCSAGREGVKSPVGAITPQRTTQALTTAFTAPSDDDFDGVDVTYTDQVTWTEETVECRLPGADTPSKVESFKLQGVGTRDRAYRIGMRRLMKYQGQRLTHSCSTGLMALVYNYGDRIKLTDDIPGSRTISTMIDEAELAAGLVRITVGEPLDWTLPNPRCLIRFQDGRVSDVLTPTRVGPYSLTIPAASLPVGYEFPTWVLDDPTVDPPELIFCDSDQVGYDAVISEVTPGNDGSIDLTALQYDPAFYQYDDATAP